MTKMIYAISDDGAIKIPDKSLPLVSPVLARHGYRECTKEQYQAKLKELSIRDEQEAKKERES